MEFDNVHLSMPTHLWKEYDFDKATTERMVNAAKRYLSSVKKLRMCLAEAKEDYTEYERRMNGIKAYRISETPRRSSVDNSGVYKIVVKREQLAKAYTAALDAYLDRMDEVCRILEHPDISRTNSAYFDDVYLSQAKKRANSRRGIYDQTLTDGYLAVYMNMPDGWR